MPAACGEEWYSLRARQEKMKERKKTQGRKGRHDGNDKVKVRNDVGDMHAQTNAQGIIRQDEARYCRTRSNEGDKLWEWGWIRQAERASERAREQARGRENKAWKEKKDSSLMNQNDSSNNLPTLSIELLHAANQPAT